MGGRVGQLAPFHHNWCFNSSTENRLLDAQSAGLSVPTIGCYQLHYVRDSVGNICVKPSGISNQPTKDNSAVSPGVYLSKRQIKTAGHDEVAELKGTLHITPDEGWSIA